MTAVITLEPLDSVVVIGQAHSFTVEATGGTLEYQWFVNEIPVDGATSATFDTLIATAENSYTPVYVIVTDTSDSTEATSVTALALSQPVPIFNPYANLSKHALMWNYKNDTFTWKDPATEQEVGGNFGLFDVDFQVFGFVPGFQQRWEDYKETAFLESTWSAASSLLWLDTFSKGKDKEMLMVSNGQLLRGEVQRNRVGSEKVYFAERTQIDFDGLSPEFRSGNVKQTKRFVMDVQGDQKQVSRGSVNKVDFYVGWSMNLMEDPKYKGPITFDLQARDFGGSYKVDYRSSGRYMGMFFDMTEASQLSFTGGEVEVAQTSGR